MLEISYFEYIYIFYKEGWTSLYFNLEPYRLTPTLGIPPTNDEIEGPDYFMVDTNLFKLSRAIIAEQKKSLLKYKIFIFYQRINHC